MECEKQKRSNLIPILTLTNPHNMTSPKYVTPMITHDCFGEDCPCQHLIPDNYRLCKFHDKYACMKHIGDEWFFFAAHRPAFVINWKDAKWYNTYEEAMDFISLYNKRA